MKINKIILKDFRAVQDMEMPLDPQLTVLVGVNGSGKTSILEALAILLSWLVARVRRSGSSGRMINEHDIHNEAARAVIGAETHPEAPFTDFFYWQLVRGRQGRPKPKDNSELAALAPYAKSIQHLIEENNELCNIPLFAYYPVNRAVLDIPLRIRQSHQFSLLEAWDSSLTSAANFRSFFEWFRNREDLENENRKYSDSLIKLDDREFPDRQLEAVRQALEAFLPEFTQFSVRRNPLRMTVFKNKREIRVDQLSVGEKCLIALVGDLARRLAIANANCSNPLQGDGVILIDEIDLHLHPAWERMILPRLTEVFPNCQFIVSTHSPQAIGEVKADKLRLLTRNDENQVTYRIPEQSKGLTTNDILDELMRPEGFSQTLTRNSDVVLRLTELFQLIDQERFMNARAEISRLREEFGDLPDLVHAEALLTMLDTGDEE